MLLRFPVTVMPVLAGPMAGETVTVKSVLPPGSIEVGLAAPEPESVPGAAHAFVFELLRGVVTFTVKSFELLSVSWQPF